MPRIIKLKDKTYLDSNSLTHKNVILSELLNPKDLGIKLLQQSYYSIAYSQYTQSYQLLNHITYLAFFLHVDKTTSTDIEIFQNVPITNKNPHWQFFCWETANDTNKPLVIHISSDGKVLARNGVAGMNYFVEIVYVNQ